MVLHNPNNWHWVNKDASPWAKEYLEAAVLRCQAEDGGVTAKISKLVSMDGDVDVSQRKNKVITIYDVKLVLEYTGSAPEEPEVSGTITVPEVAHDTEEDEFVVSSSCGSIILIGTALMRAPSLTLTFTPSRKRSSL